MGNQTLVPSQIQSVDSYLLELKSYMQFRQSLGSTTFMKTARVTLVEGDETTSSTADTGGVIDSAVATAGGVGGGGGVAAGGVGGGGSVTAVSNPGSGVGTGSDDSSLTGATPKLLLSQPQLVRQRLQRMREEQQPVVVKIFPRYDPSIRLDVYSKRVREIKNIIYSRYGPSTNCLPFYELIITDKAAFLLRQYVKYSLYDRMSTRPFLTAIEKRWLAFQLLCAVHEIHSLQIVHGDMKTENVLVNSFLWVSLADLASYKPVYLSKNHPSADFNYYFDISRRRTCCLAPERLEPTLGSQSGGGSGASGGGGAVGDMLMGEDMLMPPDPNDFAPAMDIFSLGCVLAELFMERPLFDFAQLLAYRDHKYDPSGELRQEIGDPDVLEMIFSMISLKPSERKSANEYLQEQSERAFPSYFVFLKNYISRFISARLSADEIVVKLKADLSILMRTLKQHDTDESGGLSSTYQLSSDHQQSPSGGAATTTSNTSVLSTSSSNKPPNNDAFLILLSLLLSCVRKIKLAENKFIAIDLMSQFSKFLDDSVVLDRVLPYYLCLLDDSSAPRECLKTSMVKSHVIYALNDCLTNVCNIDVRNMNIFPELIFDCLERASKDESYLVRAAVAKTISSFAITSLRYLEAAHAVRSSLIAANFGSSTSTSKQTTTQTTTMTSNNQQQQQTTSELESNQTGNILLTPTGGGHRGHHVGGRHQQPTNVIKKIDHYSYEKEFENYQMRVTEIVMHLITDISQTTSNAANAVKEALIRSNIAKLCTFFSRQKTSEFLLPHMITMLNEKTDWSVRAAFFDALCPVLSCIGWESVEIVKPLLEQGLRDSEEFVIYRTLLSLAQMAGIGLLDKQQICYFLSVHVAPLLCHPSLWIRHGAVHFVCTLCRRSQNHYSEVSDVDGANRRVVTDNTPLTVADVLCSVAPTLAKFLSRSDLIAFDRAELLFGSLKRPIPRAVYDCIAQDARSNHLFIYLAQRSEIRCLNIFNNQNYLPGYIDCADPSVQELFDRLVRLGFLEEDEDKLLHMKDFMEKTRVSRLSSSLHNQAATEMSVLAPSLRDGFISIMRDKFQRCNVELLGSKVSPFGADQLASAIGGGGQHHHEAPSSSTAARKPEPINTEWSLMFGQNRVVPEANTTTAHSATTTQTTTGEEQQPSAARLKSRGSIRGSPSETPTPGRIPSSVTRKLHDCIFDVDRYLDRCKIMYEDQRNKYLRCAARAKETINATSLSSNQVCLSGGKWRPRGHLVFHSNEHTKSIDRLSRNADATYFATLSATDGCVKIWSTESLLTAKSGFYKSVFTYDRQNHGGGGASTSGGEQQQQGNTFRPSCISFFNRHSLAILCEDYRFYVIDFNSDRTQYRLSSFERLFRANACKSIVSHSGQVTSSPSGVTSPGFNRTSFFYLNRALRPSASNTTSAAHARCSTRSCACPSNYPIEMIRIDDTSPSWPAAATSYYEYFRASPVRGLFVYSTSTGDVSCVDMRSRSRAFELRRDLSRGYVTSMITDPWYTWLALGSSYGSIELYDFRFMLPVQTFEHRLRTSVVRMCTHPGSTPTSSSDRIVASYQGNNEICVWPTSSRSTQSGEPIREPEMVFWGVQSVPPLCSNKISNSYISGLVSVASSSASDDTCGLVCASSDMKLRYVDLAEPARDSYVVSSAFNFQHNTKVSNDIAPNKPAEFAASVLSHSSITYEMKRIEGTNVLVELDSAATSHPSGQSGAQVVPAQHSNANSPALIHQSYFTHHQDAITDLVVCYNPAANRNQPLIVTSARDGTLKIWR